MGGRKAPVTAVLWGHPLTSGLPPWAVDYYLLPDAALAQQSPARREEGGGGGGDPGFSEQVGERSMARKGRQAGRC